MQDEERVLMNRLIEAERRAAHFEEACRAIEKMSNPQSTPHKIASDALKLSAAKTRSGSRQEEA